MAWTIVPRPEDGGVRNQFDPELFDQVIFDAVLGDGWIVTERPASLFAETE